MRTGAEGGPPIPLTGHGAGAIEDLRTYDQSLFRSLNDRGRAEEMSSRMRQTSLEQSTVSVKLLLEFFLTFSRFEYALKATGYHKRHLVRPPDWPIAEPDWNRFASSLRDTFNPTVNDDLLQACTFFKDSLPNQQVLKCDGIAWETPVRPISESEIEFLLRMVRCVRNNLFHGGKHSNEVHESKERTEALLKHSLTILSASLELAPTQSAVFRDALI